MVFKVIGDTAINAKAYSLEEIQDLNVLQVENTTKLVASTIMLDLTLRNTPVCMSGAGAINARVYFEDLTNRPLGALQVENILKQGVVIIAWTQVSLLQTKFNGGCASTARSYFIVEVTPLKVNVLPSGAKAIA